MISKIFYKAAMHCAVIPSRTNKDQNRKTFCPWQIQIALIVLMLLVMFVPTVRADPYEVLVVDIAAADDAAKIEEFGNDVEKFNALRSKGYSAARPYFNVLHMANGQVYFVFGFRGEVQGIHRRNYPGTIENLGRMKHKGAPKYPRMHWLPVSQIRKLLVVP
jgi:hypothetical protein